MNFNTLFLRLERIDVKKVVKTTFIIIVSLVICISFSCCTKEQTTNFSYSLEEINNGVYAIYYTTHSRAPAYNYDVITLNCNGNIKKFKVSVSITYTEGTPHANITCSNYARNDKVCVYIPRGSMQYASNVEIK